MSDDAAALIAGLCCARLASILLPPSTSHRMLAAVALGLAAWALLQAVAS